MGELSPKDTADFETAMKENEELVVAVEQARQVTDKLAGFFASMPATTLDEGRRERIAAAAKEEQSGASSAPIASVAGASTAETSKPRFLLWAVAASVLMVGLALPALISRSKTQTAMSDLASPMEPSSIERSAMDAGLVEGLAEESSPSEESEVVSRRAESSLAETRGPAAKVNAPANRSLLASDGGSATEGRRGVEKPQPMAMAMDMEPMSTSAATAEPRAFSGAAAAEKQDVAESKPQDAMLLAAPPESRSPSASGRVAEADSMSMMGMEMGMEADADMAMAMDADMMMSDDAMDMSMGMGMDMGRASGLPESKSLSASDQSESSRGRADRAKSKTAELGQSQSGPVLSNESAVKPQPISEARGTLRGGYALPTDTTVARERTRRIGQGVPVAEAVTDLLDVLEGPVSVDRTLGMGTGPGMSGDKFSPIHENEFKRVTEHPLSTLSIDVDTASYTKVRSYLQRNQLPRPDSVRIEEMVNYFDYDYTGPISIDGEPTDPFAAAMTATVCPWEPKHRLVRVGLQAKTLTDTERPRCNLVFLIDTSGSMSSANKLPLVIDGMKVLLDELDEEDQVAIVVYAGSAGLVLDSTPVKNRRKIRRALTQLRSGGSTNGGAGLQLAYDTAREHFLKDGVNRVILCSDGDFNVGMTGTDQLVREARRQAKSGIDLTVLGFGMGNHNDAMMEKISNDAEGNYAFVDTIAEARKVLSDQLAGTL
ncbi:von Willebrand factor, type A domain protein, partial [Rhodopirellula sallentina SM41]